MLRGNRRGATTRGKADLLPWVAAPPARAVLATPAPSGRANYEQAARAVGGRQMNRTAGTVAKTATLDLASGRKARLPGTGSLYAASSIARIAVSG